MESAALPEVDPRLPSTPRKREAEEWALVLQAEGLAVRVVRDASTFTVAVPPADVLRAAASLASWQAERAVAPPPPEPVAIFAPASPVEIALVASGALGLVAFQLGIERAGRLHELVDRGKNQAVHVLAGEVHRAVTALTLHADVGHAVGNALFGGFFLVALSGRLGLGLALACFVVTGTLGNLADAVYHGSGHSSIGASTGVFGLVGVLAGLAAWRRHQRATRRRGAWVALGAGLAIVAMLGGAGPKIDVAAHLFGLAVGSLAGLALAFPLARRARPGPIVQGLAALFCAAALALAWQGTAP
jgi:rhomboid protease GluP